MTNISEEKYPEYFPLVFDWFRKNVHGEEYPYAILSLRNTYRKLIELMHPVTGNVLFRVILKVTEEPIDKNWLPERNIPDLDELFNTKTENNLSIVTATQVCYIHVDQNGIPDSAILYTYSPHDEKYHKFEI